MGRLTLNVLLSFAQFEREVKGAIAIRADMWADRAAPHVEMVNTASEMLSPGTNSLAEGVRAGDGGGWRGKENGWTFRIAKIQESDNQGTNNPFSRLPHFTCRKESPSHRPRLPRSDPR